MLVLSVQMPEGDGEGWVRVLTNPERIGRESRVERLGRVGGGKIGGKRWIQLREKRWVVQHHLRAVGGVMIELRDGTYFHWRVWRGSGGGSGVIGHILRVGCWWQRGRRLLEGGGQAGGGLERRVRKGGRWVSEGGVREGSSEGRSLGLVAQIREVQGRVGRAGRYIWKRQILHVWGDGGEGKRCWSSVRGEGAMHDGSWLVLVSGNWSKRNIWINKRCWALITRCVISTRLGEQRLSQYLALETWLTGGGRGRKRGVRRCVRADYLRDGVIGVGRGGGGQKRLWRGWVRGRRSGEGEGGLLQRRRGARGGGERGGGGENGGIVDRRLRIGCIWRVGDRREGGEGGGLRKGSRGERGGVRLSGGEGGGVSWFTNSVGSVEEKKKCIHEFNVQLAELTSMAAKVSTPYMLWTVQVVTSNTLRF